MDSVSYVLRSSYETWAACVVSNIAKNIIFKNVKIWPFADSSRLITTAHWTGRNKESFSHYDAWMFRNEKQNIFKHGLIL